APADGWVGAIDAMACGLAVIDLGGGRLRKNDPIDHGAGVVIAAQVGQPVKRGDPLARVHASSEEVAHRALARLARAWQIVPEPVSARPHVHYRIDRDGVGRAKW